MARVLTCLAAAFLAVSAPAAAQVPFTQELFTVSSCDANANISQRNGLFDPRVSADPTLNIDFTNKTRKVMTEIEWGLVANGRLVAESKDVGTFSPGAEVSHKYPLSLNVFPLATGLPQCIALRVTFADGTQVSNPNLKLVSW